MTTSDVRAQEHRRRADRCPGLLRPHRAEDGLLVRLRLPGGQLTGRGLSALSRAAIRFGSGLVQLTSRGNVQLRGLGEDCLAELVDELTEGGFLPSDTHERVRNITASPLSGLAANSIDIRHLVADLDRALCADPILAELPGRFLFTIDDGEGDVAALTFDLAYQALSPAEGIVVLGGHDLGVRVPAARAVAVLCALARRFLAVRSGAWHVSELDEVTAFQLGNDLVPVPIKRGQPKVALGPIGDLASVSVPLSLLDPEQVRLIDQVSTGGPLVITPWRGLILPGAANSLDLLAEAGLAITDEQAWARLTACVGAPCCSRTQTDTRSLAYAVVDQLPADIRVHISGCGRRCGAPALAHLELIAPAGEVDALQLIKEASSQ